MTKRKRIQVIIHYKQQVDVLSTSSEKDGSDDNFSLTFKCFFTHKEKKMLRQEAQDLSFFDKILAEEHRYFSGFRIYNLEDYSFTLFLEENEYNELFYGVEEYNSVEKAKDIQRMFDTLNFIKTSLTNIKEAYVTYLLEFEKTFTVDCESCENYHKNDYCKIKNKIAPRPVKCYFYK